MIKLLRFVITNYSDPAGGGTVVKIERYRVERAARIYRTSKDAGVALGIASQSFCRLCRSYGIETPGARRRSGTENNRRCHVLPAADFS